MICNLLHTYNTKAYSLESASGKLFPLAATMEEMDVPQMKKEVESLKYQLAFKREKSSKTVTDLVKWIEDGVPEDPFLNPELMKNNPWVEKGKCTIL
ncbi:guanine nucleotide-binding protein G(I)/G(S)/G(O) subunit gamma-13 [Arapaima gigas]